MATTSATIFADATTRAPDAQWAEPDLALLQRFCETADPDVFAEIVRRYAGVVFGTCYRILRDHGRAEDVCQETFFRLLQHPERVNHSLGGWLHRAATRLAIDTQRSETSRRQRESSVRAIDAPEPSQWDEVSRHVDDALAALPDEQRELLVRHYLQGEAQSELAAQQHTSPATMSRRMADAVQSLQAQLIRRGVSVAPAVLVAFWQAGVSRTVPPTLAKELGKMALVSGLRSGGPLAAGREPAWRAFTREMARSVWRARRGITATVVGLGGAIVVAMLLNLALNGRPPHAPRRPAPREGADPARVEPAHVGPTRSDRPSPRPARATAFAFPIANRQGIIDD